jgi:PIN domain nuclease of toxin-antitoxin system
MRLLLDTHTLLWAMLNKPQLSRRAASAIISPSNEVFVSVVSIWEIATKVRIGKLDKPEDLLDDPRHTLLKLGFRDLQVKLSHARLGGTEGSHKDPFDRLLAAQALLETLTFVSIDTAFDSFAVQRLW